jgi:hypothetical protein
MAVRVLNNEQLDKIEADKQLQLELAQPKKDEYTTELAGYIRRCWTEAYQDKQDIQMRLLRNLENFNSKYSSQKLAEIRQMNGSEIFIPLTATKDNASYAHLVDIFFNSTTKEAPWDIESTPVPELPELLEEQIRGEVIMEVFQVVSEYGQLMGIDPMELLQKYQSQIVDRIFFKMRERSADAIDDLKRTIADQLEEGDWYHALKQVIMDIVIFEFGVLKGPVYRKEKYFRRRLDPATGRYTNQIEEQIKPKFERRSPFNIYPAPKSTSLNRYYLFDLLNYTLKDLYDMIGLEGFQEAAIREVIEEYKNGGLREWVHFKTEIESETARSTQSYYIRTGEIDVLEFWGAIKGELLQDWGMPVEEITDRDRYYDVCVWLVGNKVIKAMLNPDPMGKKPFNIESYVTNNDALIGGKGLSTLVEAFQQMCNAIARAIINNSALSSGPMVEFNEDRLPDNYDPSIRPWKTWSVTNNQMNDSKAIQFYQPTNTTNLLLEVYDYFSKLADQYTIPGYAHGDLDVRGAGQTASGLSMLMGSSSKVIQNVVKNIDNLIANSIELLYLFNMVHDEASFDYIGDVRIVARGSTSVMQKEQQAVRRTDFMEATNNPLDLQIIGLEGRRELIKETANALNLNEVARKFPIVDEIDELKMEIANIIQAFQEQNSGNGKKSPQTDAAGNTQSGQDNRLVTQGRADQQRPRVGK